MEQHTYESHSEGSTLSYIPIAVVAAVLALLAWILLHNYHNSGYIWDKSYMAAVHEGGEGEHENSNGHEQHEGPASAQEPQHGGEMMIGSAATGRLDSLTGNFIYETGPMEDVAVTDSLKLNVGASSSESKLIEFLKSGSVDEADKTKGWITLDRFYFETGSSKITAASQAQLKNIAAILKAYPNANLKVGGYTDNSGDASKNLSLSAARADAAKNALAAMGVDASRLSAEGYGQEHPLADNNTAEGKARNRRVDVRITKK